MRLQGLEAWACCQWLAVVASQGWGDHVLWDMGEVRVLNVVIDD